jgi:hypothetical protein
MHTSAHATPSPAPSQPELDRGPETTRRRGRLFPCPDSSTVAPLDRLARLPAWSGRSALGSVAGDDCIAMAMR